MGFFLDIPGEKSEYEYWSPHEIGRKDGCYLGLKEKYPRVKKNTLYVAILHWLVFLMSFLTYTSQYTMVDFL